MQAWSRWWVTKPSSVSLINVVGSCNHVDQEADSRAQRTAETLNTISGAAHYLHVGLSLAMRPEKRSTTRRWHIPELICGIWRRAGLVVFGLLSRGKIANSPGTCCGMTSARAASLAGKVKLMATPDRHWSRYGPVFSYFKVRT